MGELLGVDEAFDKGGRFGYLRGEFRRGIWAIVRKYEKGGTKEEETGPYEVLVGIKNGKGPGGRERDYCVFPLAPVEEGLDYRDQARRFIYVATGIEAIYEGAHYIPYRGGIIIREKPDVTAVIVGVENGNPIVFTHHRTTEERIVYTIIDLVGPEKAVPVQRNGSEFKNYRFAQLTELFRTPELVGPEDEILLELLAPGIVDGAIETETNVRLEADPLKIFDYLRQI